jgi:DNA primase
MSENRTICCNGYSSAEIVSEGLDRFLGEIEMARIPESEIERLKLQVSVVRLVEAAGVVLKQHGKDQVGRCPFHDDKTPSLVVSPKTNLWHCMGACQVGGSVIDWVMKFEGVSFRHAVELLKRQLGDAPVSPVEASPGGAEPRAVFGSLHAAELLAAADDDAGLLRWVIDFYHATLKQSPEAKRYLDARGLYSIEAIETFKLGFANRTLGYLVPDINIKAGAKLRAALQRVGLYRETGREHLNGSLVVPVCDLDGAVTEVYGRKITSGLRAGTPLHLYLPGPHRGVFNEQSFVGQEEIILCEALIDALTFWCAGYRNVTSSYGIEGLTADILEALKRHGIKRVLIAYDADDAGNAAAEKLATKLMAEGFECYRCRFPKGMDANEYALAVKPAIKSLGVVIRQAEWLGKAAPPSLRPTSISRLEVCPDDVADVEQEAAVVLADRSDAAPSMAALSTIPPAPIFSLTAALALEAEEEQNHSSGASPALPLETTPDFVPAHRVPPTAAPLPVEVDAKELRLTLGDRAYTVRGIEKNLSYEQIKVWLRVSRGDFMHIDTVELYQAKQRAAWLKAASVELGTGEDMLKGDIGKLLRVIEQRQDEIIRRQLKPTTEERSAVTLSPAQHDAAMALLRDPHLIDRIVADVEATGVVGESSNALVAYLACVSRKLDKPLAILIQSTSAAGKSTLMDALLALMPESERVHYSAMTGQSLFYLGETSMKHKILAIAEEEGVRQAAYALKVLQSSGELTIASTGKDPVTGDMQTKTYKVEGPVMLFLTTTAIDIDEELLNRCLVLTINESREQTAAIQARQRTSRTLAGLLTKAHCDHLLATHRAAQQLLLPLAVVNPFAEQLTFASDRVRLRRDHQKYLALIDSIALLHQHQRPIKTTAGGGGGHGIAYVEVTLDDIALANRLAHEVLGRSLDELPPQTRRLLGQTQQFVAARAKDQAIEQSLVRFMRRELREHTSMSDTQLRVHLDRLVALEYLVPHAGRNGQRFVYELAFDGDVRCDAPQAICLTKIEGLRDTPMTANLAAQKADLAGCLRPANGPLAATLRGAETPAIPRSDAVLLPLTAAVAQTALPSEPRARRRNNGQSYAGADHTLAQTALPL